MTELSSLLIKFLKRGGAWPWTLFLSFEIKISPSLLLYQYSLVYSFARPRAQTLFLLIEAVWGEVIGGDGGAAFIFVISVSISQQRGGSVEDQLTNYLEERGKVRGDGGEAGPARRALQTRPGPPGGADSPRHTGPAHRHRLLPGLLALDQVGISSSQTTILEDCQCHHA